MKKIIILFIILFLLSIPTYVSASDYFEYKWEDTFVDIQKYDDISNYVNIPKAKLYKNGALLSDSAITYNINGDWLYYLKDVNTAKIGQYKVWYKAKESVYNPGCCNNYKALITFNVIDTKSKLTIDILGEYDNNLDANVIKIALGKKIDYLKEGYININSNYTYNYLIDDNSVNYNMCGIYKAKIIVIDHNKEKYEKIFYVNIIDTKSPIVTLKKDLIIVEKSKDIDWDNYIIIKDDIIDTYSITLYDIDYNLIDVIQDSKVVVTDSSNNSTTVNIRIKIVDTILPIIELNIDKITLDYLTKFNEDIFKEIIHKAYDGDINLINEVVVDYSNLVNVVGFYKVYYHLTDSDNNTVVEELNVNLLSKIAPIIDVKNIKIKVNEEIDYYKYINIIDESDPNILNNLVIDDSLVDITTEGTYYVKVMVTNSSGLSSHNIIKVEVEKSIGNIPYYKIIIIILLIGLILFSIIYYKKSKSNNDELNLDL